MADAQFDVQVVLNVITSSLDNITKEAQAVGKSVEDNISNGFDVIREKVDGVTQSLKGTGNVINEEITEPVKETPRAFEGLTGIVNRVIESFRNIGGSARESAKSAKELSKNVDDANKSSDIAEQNFAGLDKRISSMVTGARKFNFIWLRLQFLGTTLQRIFGGLLRNIIDAFAEGSGRGSAFNRVLLGIAGRIEFLKFILGQAFAESELGQYLLNLFEGVLDKLITLSQEFPNLVVAVVSLVTALAGLGILFKILSIVGQLSVAFKFLAVGIIIASAVLKKFGIIATIIRSSLSFLLGLMVLLFKLLGKSIIKLLPLIGKLGLGFLKMIPKLLLIGLKFIVTVLGTMGGLIASVVVAVIAIAAAFSKWREQINRFLERIPIVGQVLRILGNILATVFNVIVGVIKNFIPSIKAALEFLKDIFINVFNAISDVVVKAVDFILDKLGIVGDGIRKVGSVINKALKFVADGTENLNKKTAERAGLWEQKEAMEESSKEANLLGNSINTLNTDFSGLGDSAQANAFGMNSLKDTAFDLGSSLFETGRNAKDNVLSFFELGDTTDLLNNNFMYMDENIGILNEDFGLLDDSTLGLNDSSLMLTDTNIGLSDSITSSVIPSMEREKGVIDTLIERYNRLAQAKQRASSSGSSSGGGNFLSRFTTAR